jgi:NitT/TauT family transport system substrate-binding protein
MRSLFARAAHAIAVIALVVGLTSGAALAKGKMHVVFGDIPGADMLTFLAAVKRAEARGIEVKVDFLQSEETASQAIISGQADIGVGTPYALIQKSKAPIRMFFQMMMLRFHPIVNTEKYKAWGDLNGADVAVHSRGSGTEAIMNRMAIVHGIKYNSVSYVPGSGVRAGAMLKGTLDATIVDTERRDLLLRKGGGKFAVLPLPEINATDEALYANVEFLERESEAIAILLEELVKVWREVNKDPMSVAALRKQYNLLPDMTKDDVSEIEPFYKEGVEIGLFPNNGGVGSVKEDFEFFTASGTLKGKAADLKVEDFWYLDPLKKALETVGKM